MFWELLLAHVLADFVFQTKSVAENKLDFKETLKHCSYLLVISVFILILAGYRDCYLFIHSGFVNISDTWNYRLPESYNRYKNR